MNKIIWLIVIVLIIGGIYLSLRSGDMEDTDLDETQQGAEQETMTFFITSENPGTGANLGGLTGADSHCQTLATSVGMGDRTWRAYLSTTPTDTEESTNARDRIGNGPWHNAKGVLIANNVEELHSDTNVINKETGLSEKGETINGRGDSPNLHDILTGSNADGTVAIGDKDTTCSNWISESADGSAIVGHHDRLGPETLETATSWNAAHGSRGCSLENLNGTGGGGLLYCFASN